MANKSNAPRLGEKTLGQKVKDFIGNNSVPIMFILICLYCIPMSGFSASYLLNEVMTRLGRNAFLILSLLIPIMAGMGLNFGMTLGAMAGEIGLIFVADWQIWGIPGLVLAEIAKFSNYTITPMILNADGTLTKEEVKEPPKPKRRFR